MNRAAAAVLLLAASAAPAVACSCVRGPNAPKPPLIVAATVVHVQTDGMRVRAALVVGKLLRGRNVPRRISVDTNASSAACGVSFARGQRLTLGMSRTSRTLYSADLCQQVAIDRQMR